MTLFRKKQTADTRKRTSVGIHFGTVGAYVTTIKGESFDQRIVEADAVGLMVRRAYNVTTGLGGPEILFKNAVLPRDIPPVKIGEAVRWQFYDVEASDYEFVYKSTDFSPDGSLIVICAAVPRKMIENFCRENSGVYTCLDVRPFALWRGFRFTHPEGEPTVLVARWPEGLTVAGGRKKIEFVREMPVSATLDSERMRTVDYFRRAFDAPDAAVIELEEEELAYLVSAGYALTPFDSDQINILPKQHRRVRPMEFKKPRLLELVAVGIVIAALTAAAPYAMAWYYGSKAKEYRAVAARNTLAVQEAALLRSEISKYQEWVDVVSGHKITPYMAMVGDVRYAVPPGVMLDDLEIGDTTTPTATAGSTTPTAGNKVTTGQSGSAAATPGQAIGQQRAGTPVRAGQQIPTDQKNTVSSQPTAGNRGATNNLSKVFESENTGQSSNPIGGMVAGQLVGSTGQAVGKAGTGGSQSARSNNTSFTTGKSVSAQNVKALYIPAVMRLSGKAKDLKLVGVLADNLSQLSYAENVKVEEAAYDGMFYAFRISVKLKAGA